MLKRFYTPWKHKCVTYANLFSGGVFSEVTKKVTPLGEDTTLHSVFASVDTPVLYLLPNKDGKYPNKADYDAVEGLTDLTFLSKHKVAKFRFNGRRLAVYPISQWFDLDAGNNLKDVIIARRELQKVLEFTFQPAKVRNGSTEKFAIELLATPAQLGHDLLQRCLPFEQEYAPLPDDISNLLIENFGQGRFEAGFNPDGGDLTELYDYDGRWFYAACTRHVPVGRIVHDHTDLYEPYIAGFYHVQMTVPAQWHHIGLLPAFNDDEDRYYPRTAGETFTSWCTDKELALAIKNGWSAYTVLERILWPDTDKLPEPLKQWTNHLVHLRQDVAETYSEPTRTLLRSSIRNIMLQALGSFRRGKADYDVYVDSVEDAPEGNDGFLKDGDQYKFVVTENLTAMQQKFSQGHWIAYVWGHARRKLAEEALKVPFDELVALRADAIWCKKPQMFVDTGKVGQFKLERSYTGVAFPNPKDNTIMRRLVIALNAESEIA